MLIQQQINKIIIRILAPICFAILLTYSNQTSANTNSIAVNAQDSLILVDFYHSTNGPAWKYSNWLTQPVSKWFGITV
ncbi:MAG TPA: hypothetical protein PLS94_11165, partial [Prolixibacteraceae bacterium]|nr:hypothetical protein [Prolixibacteraceae bacterium]